MLVSELPLGTQSWKGAFVQRDRIQSGLSLGVIAVQTDIEGGTCVPSVCRGSRSGCASAPPPEEEKQAAQNKGIWLLINQKKAFRFPTNYNGIYERLLERLGERRELLISPERGASLPTQQFTSLDSLLSTEQTTWQMQTTNLAEGDEHRSKMKDASATEAKLTKDSTEQATLSEVTF